MNPANIPIKVVNPASCKYLCPDLCKKFPDDMAINNKKIMHKISVDKAISSSSSISLIPNASTLLEDSGALGGSV